MERFIIIRGPLGIGKTTIAKEIAKKLNAKYVSIDKILENNGLDRKDNHFIPKDFIKANEIALKNTNKKRIIFDGCFYFKEQIKHLKKIDKTVVFNLKAPLSTCIKRDKGRKKVYGKQAAKEVYELVSKFDYGININTNNKTPEQVIKLIIEVLK
jgi:shikimate kinase